MACTGPANDAAVGTPRSPHTPCPLEALNTNCLTAILRASNSLADLGAFIRASPTVLRCFVSAKALLLRDAMTNELGLAIRDALVMSLNDGIFMFAAGTLPQTFDIAICAWRESLLIERTPWVPLLDDDTAADVARLTRLVLHIVDLYISLRLRHFRETLDPPCASGWGLSQAERRRIAQALVRS
ncbi:hypothetical protein C7999DRAFT_33518 [Corynascus novoguineensis]|uniref:Uncharacterized protein n=1 Tax=Corynascus novoguineensis TaxID=1126955 RepID=A0AAN7HDQ5_9PEZI|nr:hypothetical protein C7999DRAFT_33518 [Corynascus novoguineensis]